MTRVERYTPYGEPSDLQLDVGPGFTGHATDVATGLTYMQQRYYDDEIGRFLVPDPVGPEEDFINHFNRYNYAQNNPVRYTDPDGREVVALYSNDNRSMFIVDRQTREYAFVQAESGGKPYGEQLPSGRYSILERAGRQGFYRLEMNDSNYGDDSTPDNRSNLRLHGPGLTTGCISVCKTNEFKEVEGILNTTSTGNSEVKKALFGIPTGRTEMLKSFGAMHVLPTGVTLKFDSKTGDVSLKITKTGTRIVESKHICTAQKDGTCK